jgi:hypothetical protein
VLELLAAIQSVDPPSFVLWGMFAFAAGMYPVGFMLGGSCSACCGQTPPCTTCTEGELPDTVTVTFNGFTDQTPGPDLISLGFSACFGGGASARVTAPGGDPDTDKGPISAVSLTNGGSGYAKLGRVEPTLTVSGGSGTGATFTPTIESEDDACGVPFWALKSVAFKGGIGYVDGEPLTITAAEGDTEAQAAVAVVRTARTQPTLTASVAGGSGAALSASTSANYGTPATWGVSGVSVTNGGTGYMDGAAVTFSGGSDLVVVESAQAVVRTGREEPIVGVGITGTGSGADFSTTITETLDYPARPAWTVSGVTITDGGSGYSVYDMLTASTNGQQSQYSWFYAFVSEVDENGAITAVEIYDGGLFYKSTGVIDSVEISYGGSYYDGGAITAVDVTAPGQYYREDASQTPYVATVTVTVASQTAPSGGTGATFTATVEDDPESPNFGKITALAVANGGTGYLAWKWVANACCGWQLNGMPIVLKRNRLSFLGPCVYSHAICGGWTSQSYSGPPYVRYSNGYMRIAVLYNGPTSPPVVYIAREGRPPGTGSSDDIGPACGVTMTAAEPIANCDEFSFTASNVHGVTASVEPGGSYDEHFKGKHGSHTAEIPWASCTQCCQGADDIPQEVEVYIEQDRYGDTSRSGTYVLPAFGWYGFGGANWGFSICLDGWCGTRFNVGLSIAPGRCGNPDVGNCDNCVKKCEVVARCSISSHPLTWSDPEDDDLRNCPNYDQSITDEQRATALCAAYCMDVPLCAPPQGMEFSFFDPNGSENFSAAGCPNCCEENDDPTWQAGDPLGGPYTGPPRPNHLNTFKMTVQ